MALHQLRQDRVAEEMEVLLLPHEKCIVGGQPVENQLHICRVLLFQQVSDERAKIVIALLTQQGRQAACYQLPLLAEVDPILTVNEFDKFAEIFVANVGQRHGWFLSLYFYSCRRRLQSKISSVFPSGREYMPEISFWGF